MDTSELKAFLEEKTDEYNRPEFIESDPVSVPHRFNKIQDIEIAGFFAAMLAWGQRKTIIRKANELMAMMDEQPHDFVLNHSESDLQPLLNFVHRTFNSTDLLYFISFFNRHYSTHESLEEAFLSGPDMKLRLISFHDYFFSLNEFPARTKKHIATPLRNSACKRLNMFLRWMVRRDDHGVDFGVWKQLQPADLICPCDIHVERIARRLKLIKRNKADWKTAIELTDSLRQFDSLDPVRYDFALFGLGIEEKGDIWSGH